MKRILAAPLWFALLWLGCDSPAGLAPVQPDVRDYVVGEALQNLDASGHFVFNDATRWGGLPLMSRANAEALVLALLHNTLGSPAIGVDPGAGLGWESMTDGLEREHGKPITWTGIRAGGGSGTVLARSVLAPLPDSLPELNANHWGPHYLVPVWAGGEQVATFAVAATSSADVDENGRIRGTTSGLFSWGGVPWYNPWGHPIPAELAVQHVAKTFHTRIRKVPRLLQPGHNITPRGAQWELTLERPLRVRRLAHDVVVETDRLYVSQYPATATDDVHVEAWSVSVFAADADQPTDMTIFFMNPAGSTVQMAWPIQPDAPVNFHAVAPAGG